MRNGGERTTERRSWPPRAEAVPTPPPEAGAVIHVTAPADRGSVASRILRTVQQHRSVALSGDGPAYAAAASDRRQTPSGAAAAVAATASADDDEARGGSPVSADLARWRQRVMRIRRMRLEQNNANAARRDPNGVRSAARRGGEPDSQQ